MKHVSLKAALQIAVLGAMACAQSLASDDPPASGSTAPQTQTDGCKSGANADVTLLSNMGIGDLEAGKGCNQAYLHYEGNGTSHYELLGIFNRKLDSSSGVFAGGFFDHKDKDGKARDVGVFGYQRKLPLESDVMAWIDTKGRPRVEVGGEPHLYRGLSLRWAINTDREYGALAQYKLKHGLALTGGYDSRFGLGGGLRWSR